MESAITILETQRKQLLENLPDQMGAAFVASHAQLFDTYFQGRMKEKALESIPSKKKNPFSIIALGGYGRNEQCLYSDIDVLFLFKNNIPDEAETIIREMVYPLWDLKFEVGHATRTIKDCIALGSSDFQILTSLLDARLICGNRELFSALQENIYQKVVRKKKNRIMLWLSENSKKRHASFGDATYLLEPNVKEGFGGLRDYHTMLWMLKTVYGRDPGIGCKNPFQIPETEYRLFNQSLAFIWDVRNKLHQLAGRKCDRLYLEFHEDLAVHFNIQRHDDLHIIERFLGEFHEKVQVVKQQSLLFQSDQLSQSKRIGVSASHFMGRFLGKRTNVKGLIVRNNLLDFDSVDGGIENQFLLIKIILESISLGIPICGDAKKIITKLSYRIDDSFRMRKSVISDCEELLDCFNSENDIIDEMQFSEILIGMIPELKRVVNRVEYDAYHFYPVDKHLYLTVKTINDLGRDTAKGDSVLYHEIYQEITEKKPLLWAALLHDIGKGVPSADHSSEGAVVAEAILKRFGYGATDIETVSFLVKNHLLLKKTATQRDLNDEQTVIVCAAEIKAVDRLKMLYLLTVADGISTGSKAWTSWTSTLTRDLFFRILRVLEKGELATESALQTMRTKIASIQTASVLRKNHEELLPLLNSLSPRYLLAVEEKDILEHLGLFQTLGEKKFVWQVAQTEGVETRTVTICAKNHPGLFSKVTGIFSLHSLNVLDVQAFTWRNNIALDIFQVTAPKDRLFEDTLWKGAEAVLENTLEGGFDIAAAVQKKFRVERPLPPGIPLQKYSMVNIDNQTSSFLTIVEVHTYDSPGLLFWIADTIFKHGYDILVCKASTSVDQVVDIFYIRDFDGAKPDDSELLDQLKTAIEKIVEVNNQYKPINRKRSKR